ncbi:MAG: hypothetical protein ACI9CO_000037 [Candidatus Azotimanducaceae bacterium]|jgi:hypothetical protein
MTSPLRISVVNLTHGLLPSQEVQAAIRAVNRQINEDFAPHWNITGKLRLEGTTNGEPSGGANIEDMRGDAVIYLWDEADIPNAVGYHDVNYLGVPYGFVFVDIATEIGENWTVTFSHEVLELLGDRQANLLVQGPHPDRPNEIVYHWREMCDAVQAESYPIDGVDVSNFVLPLYFTPDSEPGSRNDFLGAKNNGENLQSFSVNPGGYIGFYDPETKTHETKMGKQLRRQVIEPSYNTGVTPEIRQKRKNKARMARRGNRYQLQSTETKSTIHEKASPFKSTSGRHTLKLKWSGDDLVINKKPMALADQRSKAGRFAYDIYATGQSFQEEMKDDGFRELEGLAFEVRAQKKDVSTMPRLALEITHHSDEVIIAMTEVDGVLLWHECTNPKTQKLSNFDIAMVTAQDTGRAVRAGLFSKVKNTVVRFFKHKILAKIKRELNQGLAQYLAKHIEKRAFGKTQSLKMIEFIRLEKEHNHTIARLEDMKAPLEEGGHYLLFVHGIFSSVRGAFKQLLLSRNSDHLFSHLHYDRVVGADHWTVAVDTKTNALELLEQLPRNCRIDIVCHSRGASVVRCLLEHPDILPKFKGKNINVGKVIFVAGACQGSPLALPQKIGALINTFSALSSLSNSFFPIPLVTGIFKLLQYGVKNFPGIAAMSPDSKIFDDLNKPLNVTDCEYIYMRSNYEPKRKLATLIDEGVIDRFAFDGEKNDLVVPYDGAGTFDTGVKETIAITLGHEFGAGEKTEHVIHTDFFRQSEVRLQLLKHLSTNKR